VSGPVFLSPEKALEAGLAEPSPAAEERAERERAEAAQRARRQANADKIREDEEKRRQRAAKRAKRGGKPPANRPDPAPGVQVPMSEEELAALPDDELSELADAAVLAYFTTGIVSPSRAALAFLLREMTVRF
jgi:sRNA-binding protein